MNSVMERWIGSCRRELLDRTLAWNQPHLMIVLREYEDFCRSPAKRPTRFVILAGSAPSERQPSPGVPALAKPDVQ
jgi:putative transposase